jgi:hypothetical protein
VSQPSGTLHSAGGKALGSFSLPTPLPYRELFIIA